MNGHRRHKDLSAKNGPHKLNAHAAYFEETDGLRVVAWRTAPDKEPVSIDVLIPWHMVFASTTRKIRADRRRRDGKREGILRGAERSDATTHERSE